MNQKPNGEPPKSLKQQEKEHQEKLDSMTPEEREGFDKVLATLDDIYKSEHPIFHWLHKHINQICLTSMIAGAIIGFIGILNDSKVLTFSGLGFAIFVIAFWFMVRED